jgi:hypothetical protein
MLGLAAKKPGGQESCSGEAKDVLLTVIASGIYRMFAKLLHGYERAQARQILRRFLARPSLGFWEPKPSSRRTS